MHAFDHDLPCQLKNSGMYHQGAGRRVGEQTEHAWSLLKPLGKLLRYASYHHWHDQFNACLLLLSRCKQLEFPQLLATKIKGLVSTKGECIAGGGEAGRCIVAASELSLSPRYLLPAA